MQLIDKHRAESEAEHIAYTEFVLSYKPTRNLLYCFFEGFEDVRYYGIRIEQNTRRKYEDFVCHGFERVLGVNKLIKNHSEYRRVRTLFFIDKDYGKKISQPAIYLLPCYSVENLYTSKIALQRILKHEFNMKSRDIDYDLIIRMFERLQKQFHRKILLLNSWLACQSDINEKSTKKVYLNIDSKIKGYFQNIVNPDLKTIKDLSDLNDIKKIEEIFDRAPKVSKSDLSKKIVVFRKINKSKAFRGKFELMFFISFLDRLKNEIGKRKSSLFSKSYSCNLRFEYATAISSLSQYAETSKCLLNYLNKHSKKAA